MPRYVLYYADYVSRLCNFLQSSGSRISDFILSKEETSQNLCAYTLHRSQLFRQNLLVSNHWLNMSKPALVAIIGIGLVGSEFVEQLIALPEDRFSIVSLSTSKTTIFSSGGLEITSADWKSQFKNAESPTIMSALLGELSVLRQSGRKVVMVDNTSSDSIAKLYPDFLASGIDIITPNKKAFSSELSLFDSILAASNTARSKFLNEATVGAGLPIISTLKDLVATGDKVSRRKVNDIIFLWL